ncbi:TauD/TfdA family dioxygenase [Streptomyces bottropensis]|uniref:TauD/TfdA family dioxygenase n=1 Tax=Streptomyces bottropensis TaxID=42235 RepID=A0ABU8AY65_9ACTN
MTEASGTAAVEISSEWAGRTLPALVSASRPGTDLAAWLGDNRELVNRLAIEAGAVLFRGFAVADDVGFRATMDVIASKVLDYGERSSPRKEVSSGVYTSTEYPADQHILLHNEQSYSHDWPTRIVFFCERPATRGGRTPLADSRRVLAGLSDSTVEKFERLGVLYVRNYLPGVSLSWQEAFQTGNREDVEAYCARAGISVEWVDDEQLRTQQVRPAVHRHPVSGARTWFNHACFFHVTSLPDEVSEGLLSVLEPEDLPYNTYYGDGTPIEPETLDEIRKVLADETTGFDWEQGDVLLVENMITAHAREPFEGPRRILTAMADPISTLKETP